jgi:hypothetical protein
MIILFALLNDHLSGKIDNMILLISNLSKRQESSHDKDPLKAGRFKRGGAY